MTKPKPTYSVSPPSNADLPPPEEISYPSTPVIPHNVEAEKSVLGAVLINPEAYYNVSTFLRAEDFYIHRHRWIWEAIKRLIERRDAVDFVTIASELDRAGQLKEAGGDAYLTELVGCVPTSSHAEDYARLVEKAAIRRQVLMAANALMQKAYDKESELSDLQTGICEMADVIGRRMYGERGQIMLQATSQAWDRFDTIAKSGKPQSVETGFVDLDKILSVRPGDLALIAARPSQGKTSLLLSIARNAAIRGQRVAIFSLEMTNAEVTDRLWGMQAEIPPKDIMDGRVGESQTAELMMAFEAINDWKIFLDDTPAITPTQLLAKCKVLRARFGLDLIIVDYVQLLEVDGRRENRTQEMSYISRNLKAAALDLNLPILAASQLSRAVEARAGRRPILSDLRESGTLEQDADAVVFISRDEYNIKAPAEIIVAKQRNGPTGKLELVFRQEITRFESAASDDGRKLPYRNDG